jgi:hypothetical protein
MGTKATVTKQQKLIDQRVQSIRRALEGNVWGSLFNANSQIEVAYLMGASHGLQWAKNDPVYPPAEFKVIEHQAK